MATDRVSWIYPETIKYTQDSIKAQFRDGRELTSTLEDLLYGRKTVADIPLIEVVDDLYDNDGGFLAMTGHRRLYLYKKLAQLGVVEKIPVSELRIVDYWVYTRNNERKPKFSDIRLRGGEGELRINQVIDRWRSSRPSIRIRDKQLDTISVQPTYQRTTPKEESEASVNSKQNEVPLEQFALNDDTTENKEGVATDEDPLLEDDEKIATTYQPLKETIYTGPAISYQPLRDRSYARIDGFDDDECCSCCSCSCCSWCCSCC